MTGVADIRAQTRPQHRSFERRLLRKPLADLAMLWLAIIVAGALLAPWIAPYNPIKQSLLSLKQLPSAKHLLGTDALGRDVMSRLLFGGMPTLTGILVAVVVAGALGVAMGIIAGYFGRWIDRVIDQVIGLMMTLPTIVIMLTVLAIFDHNMTAAMITVGIIGSAGIARVVRSATLGVRGELYIEAARIAGLSDIAVLVRHVLPRIAGAIIVQLSLFAAIAVIVQTGISFLGLGIKPPAPTWGGMIQEAALSVNDFPWLLVPAGLTVALTILAFGLMGDAVRDALAEGWSGGAAAKARTVPPAAQAAPGPADPAAEVSLRGIAISTDAGASLVRNVDFDLFAGQTLGIVGESGSGKTLTSLALIGLLPQGTRAVSGRMTLSGKDYDLADTASLSRLRGSTIGMIFQEPMAALDPCFTVGHHLTEVIRHHKGLGRREAWAMAIDLLKQVKIPDPEAVARRYPHQISGGMAQRVGIARALAPEPRVLLADEPTTALDVTVQAEILDLIRALTARRKMAVVFVTHDWGVVADICDRAMVLYKGDVLETASVADIFARPQHPYTKALLRANPYNAEVGQRLPTLQDSLAATMEAAQ